MPVVQHQAVNAWITSRDVTLRLAWNDASGQEVVDVSLLISAAIFRDDQTVGQICSSAYR